MTIDEAIKRIEEVVEEDQRVIDTGNVFDDETIDMLYRDDTEFIEECLENYRRNANENRQLVEWLKDYKRLLERKPCDDTVTQKLDEWDLRGKRAELWIIRGKLQIRYMGTIHNINYPSVTPTHKEWIQIPVSEKLPKCEQKVLVLVLSRGNTYTITTGMYEDGSMSECDSIWNWEDVEFEKWDDENDCGIVPEGWYEYHEFNPDCVLNYAIYGNVVAWMPLPE